MSIRHPSINDVQAIERCILRSKYILMAKSVQHTRKEEDYFLNRMPTASLTSLPFLKEFDNELFVLMDGWKRDIANYLRPMLHSQKVDIEDKFWFTLPEMAKGYITLSTREMIKYGVDDRVLLLSKVEVEKETLLPGTIITWVKHREISDFIQGVVDDNKFLIHYMLRKSKKNGKK